VSVLTLGRRHGECRWQHQKATVYFRINGAEAWIAAARDAGLEIPKPRYQPHHEAAE
jgi:hypothetical protein